VISLVVPVAHDDAERDRNWSWCRARYPQEWEFIEAPDPGVADWSKGRAVNAAVERASHEVLVIADADVYIGNRALERALLALICGSPWVVPHRTVYRLTEGATRRLLAQDDPPDPRPVNGRQHEGPAGGGIVILTREAFDRVGGIDPRFTGWGGEDISFARALDALVGPHIRLEAPLWHLWHRPLPRHPGRRAAPANEQLAARYLDARDDRERMADLVAEIAP
jgi:hypothetical protein